MDNKTRMSISDPERPRGKYFWYAIGSFALAGIVLFVTVILHIINSLGGKHAANVIHKIFHHFKPHTEDPDSKDIMKDS